MPPGPGANAPAAPTAPAPPTEGEKLIDAAIVKVEAIKSVSADLRQELEMLGLQFQLRGTYLKDTGNRFAMKISVVGLAATNGTMLQVSDGVTLWDYQQILESQSCRKLGIGPVLAKVNAAGFEPELRDQIINQFGLAGPVALLKGLRRTAVFDQKEADTIEGRPVWVLRGLWKDRTGLVSPDRQPLSQTGPLPPYIPKLVAVWIGQDDGWPYEVDMTGQAPTILADTRQRDAFDQPIGLPSPPAPVQITRIKLFYTNVKLNPTINSKDFNFQVPPQVDVQDDTETFVTALDQATKRARLRRRPRPRGTQRAPGTVDRHPQGGGCPSPGQGSGDFVSEHRSAPFAHAHHPGASTLTRSTLNSGSAGATSRPEG